MPYPQNYETAIEVENIVRQQVNAIFHDILTHNEFYFILVPFQNAIPATIAIINGKIKVGLTDNELHALAKKTGNIPKVKTSRRDMAYVLSKRWNGGTTVAGTLIIANMVGIDIFATGGIGGVHRDGQNTMDISADLTELGKSAVTVVSSGVKSILDIPRTLEYLETQGVMVSSYQSEDNDFPAFYTRRSGYKAPYNIDTPKEAAAMILTAKSLKLNSGILIAVPVPEKFAMDGECRPCNIPFEFHARLMSIRSDKQIDEAITDAFERADAAGVSGKEATPFLLDAISKITQGKSLATSILFFVCENRLISYLTLSEKTKTFSWTKVIRYCIDQE